MNKNKILIVIFLLLTIGVLLYLLSQSKNNIHNDMNNIGLKSKSTFIFNSIQGNSIEIKADDKVFNIAGMEDKIVFLKVFGWDCKFCQKEIPELVKLKKQLGESFEVIAIEAQQHSRVVSLQNIKKLGINYPIINGESQKEFYKYLQEKYAWTGIIPLTIVVAKGGEVLAFELGAKSYSLSELMQASLLK
jgi:thiol-disulfide isomerase/thioredoxin